MKQCGIYGFQQMDILKWVRMSCLDTSIYLINDPIHVHEEPAALVPDGLYEAGVMDKLGTDL